MEGEGSTEEEAGAGGACCGGALWLNALAAKGEGCASAPDSPAAAAAPPVSALSVPAERKEEDGSADCIGRKAGACCGALLDTAALTAKEGAGEEMGTTIGWPPKKADA